MKIRIFATMAIAALITGCSDDTPPVRNQLISDCMRSAPEPVCECVHDHLGDIYSPEELEQDLGSALKLLPDFMEDYKNAMFACFNQRA